MSLTQWRHHPPLVGNLAGSAQKLLRCGPTVPLVRFAMRKMFVSYHLPFKCPHKQAFRVPTETKRPYFQCGHASMRWLLCNNLAPSHIRGSSKVAASHVCSSSKCLGYKATSPSPYCQDVALLLERVRPKKIERELLAWHARVPPLSSPPTTAFLSLFYFESSTVCLHATTIYLKKFVLT